MPVTIREAKLTDLETIASFQMAMAKETEGIELEKQKCLKGVGGVFEDPNRGNYFIAELDGKIVGSTLITHEWSDWRNGIVWWIQSVYVRPEARGQKVFKSIYEKIKNLGLENSQFRGLRLYVEKHNVKAKAVYQALGMTSERYDLFEWMTDY
ncbi:MAG: family N-acetyltransferase [Bacteriovoracaceae bacterium]|nr:family N-acetyltransferase [Bacteriovoracaceae bacterium]